MGLAGWQSPAVKRAVWSTLGRPLLAPTLLRPGLPAHGGPGGCRSGQGGLCSPSRVKPETFRQPQLYLSSACLGPEGEGRGKSWATAGGDTGKHLSGRELFGRGSVSFPKGR